LYILVSGGQESYTGHRLCAAAEMLGSVSCLGSRGVVSYSTVVAIATTGLSFAPTAFRFATTDFEVIWPRQV